MFKDSPMRVLIKKRYAWVLFLGALIFLLAIGVAFVGTGLLHQTGEQLNGLKNLVELVGFIGFYVFVLGMLLVVFSPYTTDKNVFFSYHKFMVTGFAIASLSIIFVPPILNFWGFGKVLTWIGGGLILIGILKVRRA